MVPALNKGEKRKQTWMKDPDELEDEGGKLRLNLEMGNTRN